MVVVEAVKVEACDNEEAKEESGGCVVFGADADVDVDVDADEVARAVVERRLLLGRLDSSWSTMAAASEQMLSFRRGDSYLHAHASAGLVVSWRLYACLVEYYIVVFGFRGKRERPRCVVTLVYFCFACAT